MVKGSKQRNKEVVDRFAKYDSQYKQKMNNRKKQEAEEEKKLMKKLFRPTINQEYGTAKKESAKDQCKSA
jgi:hypothetical protein